MIKYKVGLDSETLAISLVDMPAIEEDFVYLKKQDEEKKQVFLESNEKHMIYGAVLIPDKEIYRHDDNGEYLLEFTQESIEKMAYDFLRQYRQSDITLMHEEFASEVTVVESWLKTDMNYDKSIALGLNKDLPIGTWFAGMKVNNIETWEKIKSGELKGFSVESFLYLEDFRKQDKEDFKSDDNFWTKMKNLLKEVFCSNKEEEPKEQNTIEPVSMTEMEEQTPNVEPTVDTQPNEVVEQPIVEEQTEPVVEEPKAEEPKAEEQPKQEEVVEQPKEDPQNELIKNLLEEIKGLKDQINDLSSKPSTKPVNVQSGGEKADTYSNWRKTMARYM